MTELTLDVAPLTPGDLAQIEKLDERAFGPGRFTRTAYRLREGVPPVASLSFVARVGTFLVGANIMTEISCGGVPALLLGPLTVEPAFRSRGIGERLVARSMEAARASGHRLVLLVGDEPYYQRMGPVDPMRILICELAEGAFDNVHGPVTRA
jgi:predicted N-acetyltransferase YhbS